MVVRSPGLPALKIRREHVRPCNSIGPSAENDTPRQVVIEIIVPQEELRHFRYTARSAFLFGPAERAEKGAPDRTGSRKLDVRSLARSLPLSLALGSKLRVRRRDGRTDGRKRLWRRADSHAACWRPLRPIYPESPTLACQCRLKLAGERGAFESGDCCCQEKPASDQTRLR